MSWKLSVRTGPRVERMHFAQLEEALEVAEQRALELSHATSKQAVRTPVKRFEPGQQVAARIELAGPERLLPSVHAGLDVRGDGSTEAYMGRLRRQTIGQLGGESPSRALRRVLEKHTSR